jgi:two-component system repressor protein LuxO
LFEMREGRLREDLFYRLHVVPLRIPPLRERGDDVIALATHFLAKFCEAEGKETENFSDECVKELLRYPWPGNVRQLENIVHRVVLMTEGGRLPVERLSNFISDSDLGDGSRTSNTGFKSSSSPSSEGGGFNIEPLWMTEKRAIQAAIDSCEGNINKAAGLLEVAPSTIYRKIQSWKASGDI